jgi:hypothetical protein
MSIPVHRASLRALVYSAISVALIVAWLWPGVRDWLEQVRKRRQQRGIKRSRE